MEEVMKKERLMMILNAARKEGIDEITVKEPYFQKDILDIKLDGASYKVSLRGKETFNFDSQIENYWDSSDIPGFQEYKGCLISSGLIDFDNWDKFVEWIGYLYQSEIDPGLSSRSVFLTIDTNLAYFRFFSRRFPVETQHGTVNDTYFDYLLSSIVESEIDHHIREKYDDSDLKMLGMYTKIGDLRFNFRNRGRLMTRKAKFATQELNYIRGKLNAARIKGSVSKTDSEKNDIRIVESLEHFAWDRNIAVALISADRNMGNHAENSEIPYFVLELPHAIDKEHTVEDKTILNLLHDLALTFGAIRLDELETVLFGIWGGKTDGDYRDESTKVWINPNSKIYAGMKRDIYIINNLKKL